MALLQSVSRSLLALPAAGKLSALLSSRTTLLQGQQAYNSSHGVRALATGPDSNGNGAGSEAPVDLQQLYGVHKWLLDNNLAAAEGAKVAGLLPALSQQQLDECRRAWEDQVAHHAAGPGSNGNGTQLQQLMAGGLGTAKPQHIANVLRAVAESGQQVDSKQLDHILAAFVSKLSDATSLNVANTLIAVAKFRHQVPQQQLEQLIKALASPTPPTPQQISNLLLAFAKTGQELPQQHLHALLADFTASAMLAVAKPQEIANVVWALGTLRQPVDSQQLQLLVAVFVSKLSKANSKQISRVLWAMGQMGRKLTPWHQQAMFNRLLDDAISGSEDDSSN